MATYIARLPNVNTQFDSLPIRLNSRAYVQASGSSIAVQSKPDQTVTTTGDVIGAEFSPRVSDAGAGALIALKADPVVRTATAARTVSAVRGVEVNIDMPDSGSAYTITNNVNAFRAYLDMGSGHTVSGKKAVLCVATPNTSGWDYLYDLETSAGMVVASAVGGSQSHKIRIRSAGTEYFIPLNTT